MQVFPYYKRNNWVSTLCKLCRAQWWGVAEATSLLLAVCRLHMLDRQADATPGLEYWEGSCTVSMLIISLCPQVFLGFMWDLAFPKVPAVVHGRGRREGKPGKDHSWVIYSDFGSPCFWKQLWLPSVVPGIYWAHKILSLWNERMDRK